MKRIIKPENLQKYRKEQPFQNTPTIEEWLKYWMNTYIEPNCKPNTYANFHTYIHSHILPIIGDYIVTEITSIELQYYVDYKLEIGRLDGSGGLSIKTVKEHIGLLNTAFKKAVAINIIAYNPVQNIIYPKNSQVEIETLSIEEQKNIDEHINTVYQPNSLIPILLGVYAGLRIGEISALRINDINLESKQICVDESLNRIPIYTNEQSKKYKLVYGSTKSNVVRYIPMNEDIYQAFTTYFNTMPESIKQNTDSPLFINTKNNVMEPQNIAYHFHKFLKRLNIKDYHFHCLRHTFATRAMESDIDVKSCSKILGHSTVQITMDRYTHATPAHLSNEIQKLSHSKLVKINKKRSRLQTK